ncbi:MAG: hypothetical protein PHF17_00845 [Arcobacteraceae bacterium]|nr:hypothetical protein [Arcobacteraceae bacterium]
MTPDQENLYSDLCELQEMQEELAEAIDNSTNDEEINNLQDEFDFIQDKKDQILAELDMTDEEFLEEFYMDNNESDENEEQEDDEQEEDDEEQEDWPEDDWMNHREEHDPDDNDENY